MEFLIACDLEGIHGVVGEPFKTLNESNDYQKAIDGAILEINVAAKALFDCGATKVYVWDNHGSGKNLNVNELDRRLTRVDTTKNRYRFDFLNETNVRGIVFLGYHAKEGAPRGVLAHSYSSVAIQYIKLNGETVGELYVDSRICSNHGVKPLFHAGDDVSVNEMQAICPFAKTVVTKYGKSRNSAVFRDTDEVLGEIYDGVCAAVAEIDAPYDSNPPEKLNLEIRYTRAERTEQILERAKSEGVKAYYGEDTHVLHFEIDDINRIPCFL